MRSRIDRRAKHARLIVLALLMALPVGGMACAPTATDETTPILQLPVLATLHSPVLLPDVLLQLRDTAPLRPDGRVGGATLLLIFGMVLNQITRADMLLGFACL